MENQTVPTQIQTPKVPIKSFKFPIIPVLLVILVILLGLSSYLYYQNIQLKTMLASYQTPVAVTSPTPTATADPTANWKTYTNTKWNFSIDYPKDWALSEIATKIYLDSKSDPSIEIDLSTPSDKKCLTDSQMIAKQISITTQSGIFEFCQRKLVTENETFTSMSQPKLKIIANTGSSHSPIFIENEKLLNQILSTFKFLGQDDIQTLRQGCVDQFSKSAWNDIYKICSVNFSKASELKKLCDQYKGYYIDKDSESNVACSL